MITGPVTGGTRTPDHDLKIFPVSTVLLHPEPAPAADQALPLLEDARLRVRDTLPLVSCLTLPAGTITHKQVTDWTKAQAIAEDPGSDLIDTLSAAYCPNAPMGAAVVAAWRGLAVAALAYRRGHVAWRFVTDAAERSARFADQAQSLLTATPRVR